MQLFIFLKPSKLKIGRPKYLVEVDELDLFV